MTMVPMFLLLALANFLSVFAYLHYRYAILGALVAALTFGPILFLLFQIWIDTLAISVHCQSG